MKYTIKFTNSYKKNYKLMKKRGLNIELLDNVVEQIANGNKLDKKYKDHELTGNLKGFR